MTTSQPGNSNDAGTSDDAEDGAVQRAVVLDYLPHGRPEDDRPQYEKSPIAYALGETDFRLFELTVADGADVSIGDRVAVASDRVSRYREVDWEDVTRDVAGVFSDAGVDAAGVDLWGMLELADETNLRDDVEAVIGGHEDVGARRSERLPHADTVGRFDSEGVCSLNCERACRTALDVHDLSAHVDSVVGRDTLSTWKPDPEPLLETIRRMDASVENTVFVGDSVRDEEAARRADVAFRYVGEAVADDGVVSER